MFELFPAKTAGGTLPDFIIHNITPRPPPPPELPTCVWCGSKQSSDRDLRSHKKSCSSKPVENRNIVCLLCSRSFKSSNGLRTHLRFCSQSKREAVEVPLSSGHKSVSVDNDSGFQSHNVVDVSKSFLHGAVASLSLSS